MLLSNAKRLKIQGIIKRIAQDKSVTLEERIYVEKFAQHNSTISFWLKKANSLSFQKQKEKRGLPSLFYFASHSLIAYLSLVTMHVISLSKMLVINTTFQQLLSSFFNLANSHSSDTEKITNFLQRLRSIVRCN